MQRSLIKDLILTGVVGTPVTVGGWVRTKRQSKQMTFIAINDGSCFGTLQLVMNTESISESLQDVLKEVHTGSAILAHGVLKESPAKEQKWELELESLELLGGADPETYPLQKKEHTLEFLREIAHLRARTNTFGAVFRLRNVLAQAIHRFFNERNFVWAHTPILTASDCEGAGEMFTVTNFDLGQIGKAPKTDNGGIDFSKDFFGKRANLTVSGQLEGEFLALAMGRIYTFGPTFRAENSNTSRHLAEFWMVEPEVAFADLGDNMILAEDFLKYTIKAALKECPEELKFFEKFYKNTSVEGLEALANAEFERVSYTRAVELLRQSGMKFEYPVEWGKDLQTEHERYLTEQVFKKPVIVYDYPKDIKAFYMRLNDDGKTVAAMDVLVPGVGELIGGSQREDRLELLTRRMQEMSIPDEDLQWYLDLRRYGGVPHAGFGLGFERLVMYISGMQNIRDVILCPRAPGLINF